MFNTHPHLSNKSLVLNYFGNFVGIMHQCNLVDKKCLTLGVAKINLREKVIGTWHKALGCIEFQGFLKHGIV